MNIIRDFLENIGAMIIFAATNAAMDAYYAGKQVDLFAVFANTATIIALISIAFLASLYNWKCSKEKNS